MPRLLPDRTLQVNRGSQSGHRSPGTSRTKQGPPDEPVELLRRLIENSTRRGQIVLDPYSARTHGASRSACPFRQPWGPQPLTI